jgi:2-polyprenyl-6-hydroxyphenyl methylase/3-demethylubiquinone-9 3-methyltransferase
VNTTDTVREKYLAYNAERNAGDRRYDGFRNELKYFRRARPFGPGLKFLDVGCGPGLFTEFMTEQGVEGAGVDIDRSLVATAQARLDDRGLKARFLVGRVEQLPYRDGSFDICVANSILEHAVDWAATLREVTRVLRPGGLLVFYTTNRLHPFQQEVNHFPFYPWLPARLKTIVLAWIMKHRPDMVNYTEFPAIHWFTYEELETFLTGLGYVVSTRLDLVAETDLGGWKAAARPVLRQVRRVPLLRRLYYLYSRDVSVYAIKRSPA